VEKDEEQNGERRRGGVGVDKFFTKISSPPHDRLRSTGPTLKPNEADDLVSPVLLLAVPSECISNPGDKDLRLRHNDKHASHYTSFERHLSMRFAVDYSLLTI